MASAGAPSTEPRTVRVSLGTGKAGRARTPAHRPFLTTHTPLQLAIQGCCHGDLDQIYATVAELEAAGGRPIDALLICGDFQAVRNADDLECLACPPKYRALKDFHAYYAGVKRAPVLTIFIGGNHEASNHLAELAHGGWVSPNIYYAGHAGALLVHGVRLAGLSGIYKGGHYRLPRTEAPPYTPDTLRSAYHVRALDAHRLARLAGTPIDVFLSHDWPTGIAAHGDTDALVARKPFLRSEIDDGSLGSPAAASLLASLRPAHWFSAHLHTKFAALVEHGEVAEGGSMRSPEGSSYPTNPAGFSTTRFLALDKCLPGRAFLQVVDVVPSVVDAPAGLAYDAHWCAILQKTASFEQAGAGSLPSVVAPPTPDEVAAAAAALTAAHGSLAVPLNFEVTARPPPPGEDTRGRHARGRMPTGLHRNPQTVHLLSVLGMEYRLPEGGGRGGHHNHHLPPPPPRAATAADAIFEAAARVAAEGAVTAGGGAQDDGEGGGVAVADPNAIDLDDV